MAYRDRGEHKRALENQKRKRRKGDDLRIVPLSKAELHEKRTKKGLEDQRRLTESTKEYHQRRRLMEIEMERQKSRRDWKIPQNLRKLFSTSKDA